MKKDALVKNCADPDQVREADKQFKNQRDQDLEDVRFILDSKQGRRFLWRLLTHCKTFESIWEPSAKIHYNAGVQNVGHFLMAEVVAANDDALLQMMKEAKDE